MNYLTTLTKQGTANTDRLITLETRPAPSSTTREGSWHPGQPACSCRKRLPPVPVRMRDVCFRSRFRGWHHVHRPNPPAPPQNDLVDMTTAETFWVVKNGL